MRAFYELGFRSRGIERVITQLDEYRPDAVEGVSFPREADFIILHVIGRHEHMLAEMERILKAGQRYAVIQYALQSTRNPNPSDWAELWNNAEVVWSYYDITQYCDNFYHAPLAADPEVFYSQPAEKKYIVGTNGANYKAECLGEVRMAAWEAQGRVVHVGPRIDRDPNVDYTENITDDELRGVYNSASWWSCLRRKDGFELGAVEALLCGTRPVVFDNANYRQWFDSLAEFVPECEPGELTKRLKKLFLSGEHPVTKEEIAETKQRFNWERIINGFWDRILHG